MRKTFWAAIDKLVPDELKRWQRGLPKDAHGTCLAAAVERFGIGDLERIRITEFDGKRTIRPDVCDECHAYLKTYSEDDEPNIFLRDWTTLHLDLLAEEQHLLKFGAVVIDENKCVGCVCCRTNCPFNVPRIDPERNKSTKCDLCFDRIEHGMIPSCAKTCTADAIHFGTKAAMTQLAEERLKEIRMSHPNAQLYGVKPNGGGGTHMMYVLPEPIDPKTPASIDLWRDYIRPLGKVAGVGAVAGLAGVFVLSKILGNKGA